MKKFLVTSLLAITTAASAQGNPATPQSNGSSQAGNSAQPQPGAQQPVAQQKTIKDPAEYNAYMAALGQTDPHQKASALESFLTQYAGSVVKEDALEQLMVSYQQANDVPKTTDAANRVLQVNPNNLRALVLLTYFSRLQAQQNPAQAQQLMSQAAQFAERGLQALQGNKTSMPDADFEKLKAASLPIFYSAKGSEALATKDYPTAQQALRSAVDANPNNVEDVYPLALSFLQSKPKVEQLTPQEAVNGLWYMARAVNLTAGNPTAQQQIAKAGQYYFKKYHGSEDGWQQLVAQAASTPNPPAGFSIGVAPPPPTPKEFASIIMAKYNNNPGEMAYEDWLFILGSGNQQAADTVWTFLKGKVLPVRQAKVVSATSEEVQLATTDDAKAENKADVTVRMKSPLRTVPQPGALANYWGMTSSYSPSPLNVVLTDGTDKDPNAKTPPVHKPAAKPAARRHTAH